MTTVEKECTGLPVGWRRVRAEEVALQQKGAIVSGPFGSNIGKRFFVDSGVPVIRGSNLTLGVKELVDEGYVFITEEKAHELRNCVAHVGDIVFTAAGTLGQVGRIPEKAAFARYVVSNKQLRLRPDPNVSDSKYLYYWFSSPRMQRHIQNRNTGASIPLISLATLRSLPVNLPPLEIQRRIAHILSGYDELIDNCQRRIQILEAMARALYRKWFVEFHFPGHEEFPRVASTVGDIPQGWGVNSVSSFCSLITRGVTPKYEAGSGRFIINQKVNRGLDLYLADLKELQTSLEIPAHKVARFGDVLVNCLGEGTLGRVHFYAEQHQNWAVDQHMSICRAGNVADSLFIYFALASPEGQSRIESLKTGGTNMTMFNISALRSFDLVEPPKMLRDQFSNFALPMMQQKQTLIEIARALRSTRDLLLPRLLSGQTALTDTAS